MPPPRKNRLSPSTYIQGILAGERLILSRAITLIESQLPEDRILGEEVINALLPHTGNSIRVGITGSPGVGKSTFIEALGKHLTGLDKKIAVLAVDPSSQRSQGSILGDKTRMESLAIDPLAFIRPSPTSNSLGGVARKTRETILLCEAARFEIILIETVGVGQSETAIRGMADFFLLLMLAGAGDELQGIKKGIMEMADAVVITKADGANLDAVQLAQADFQNALHLFPPSATGWQPSVLTCSALENQGIREVWELMEEYQRKMQANGFFQRNRQRQQLQWMHELIQLALQERFYNHPAVKSVLERMEREVTTGETAASLAARRLLTLYEQTHL